MSPLVRVSSRPCVSTPDSSCREAIRSYPARVDTSSRPIGTTPYWLDAPYETRPALAGELEVETCVTGGGVGGLSCARRLAQHGIETILLEAGTVAGGASGRNGGFL